MEPERLTMTVPEAARLLHISRGAAYEAVKNGSIPSRRIGKRIVISRSALEAWLNGGNGR